MEMKEGNQNGYVMAVVIEVKWYFFAKNSAKDTDDALSMQWQYQDLIDREGMNFIGKRHGQIHIGKLVPVWLMTNIFLKNA